MAQTLDDDLLDSSDHRSKGLMPPAVRMVELTRILSELAVDWQVEEDKHRDPQRVRVSGAQDLCFRLYSAAVADTIAEKLGITRQQWREAMELAIRWKPGEG